VELLNDMMEHEDWQPNLARLEQLTDAAQMEQIDYAEAWAWVYYLLHSEPRKRELLTNYLAEVSAQGPIEPLSARLASLSAEPERTLAEYVAELPTETAVR
jgi:hypothetical protein